MSHIFISYSHKDSEYAHALADRLQSMGFPVWIDARLDYGSQWPHEVQKYLDSCDAFIVVMSPRSFASAWVQSELQRAKRKGKPVFPLLLEGDETWLSVESTQYYDVRNGVMPNEEFYADLKQAISARPADSTREAALNPSQSRVSAIKPEPVKNIRQGRGKNVGLLAAGGTAAVCICLFAGVLLFQRVADKGLSPTVPIGTDIITAQSSSTSPAALILTEMSPNPIAATTIVLPVQLPDGSEVRIVDVAARNEYRYTVLSAQREVLSQDKYLLRLRIRAWTSAAALNFWSDSFRLVAGDLSLSPVNNINLVVRTNETVDGDVEFEIDAALKDAILRITVAYSLNPAWTKELRLVFP